MTTTKKKKTRKGQETTESTQLVGEWIPVGKLLKSVAFKQTAKLSAADALHKEIIRMIPDAKEIMEVGVSPATEEFLEKKLTEFAKKKYPYLRPEKIKSAVAMEMLNSAPCTVEGGKDFVLYRRKK